jgi:ribosome-associated protein
VNKVSTRVELVFDVNNSSSLSATQKEIILTRLKSRIGADGCLRVSSQDSRSQWRNREDVLQKFIRLLSKALKEVRPRIVTSATRTSRERRLKTKKLESRKKATRQYPDIE